MIKWIERHYANLPTEARPSARTPEDLRLFGNMLASYVATSFDWSAHPAPRLASSCGCRCELCAVLVAGPHLQTKKVTTAHKRRARRLMEDSVRQLALDLGRALSEEQASAFCDVATSREDLAMVAYAHELSRRAQGVNEGPAALALWRAFAWTREGSPKKNFEMRTADVLAAEQRLRGRISAGRR